MADTCRLLAANFIDDIEWTLQNSKRVTQVMAEGMPPSNYFALPPNVSTDRIALRLSRDSNIVTKVSDPDN